jgi:hypothetical protein
MKDLVEYFDPVVAESVIGYSLTMKLRLRFHNGMEFIRDYYDVEMSNGDLVIYYTTNEHLEGVEASKYYEEFYFFFSHKQAVAELRKNELLDVYGYSLPTNTKFNKIILYTPEIISDDFKQVIKNELIEQMDGYTERDFDKEENSLLNNWLKNILRDG